MALAARNMSSSSSGAPPTQVYPCWNAVTASRNSVSAAAHAQNARGVRERFSFWEGRYGIRQLPGKTAVFMRNEEFRFLIHFCIFSMLSIRYRCFLNTRSTSSERYLMTTVRMANTPAKPRVSTNIVVVQPSIGWPVQKMTSV